MRRAASAPRGARRAVVQQGRAKEPGPVIHESLKVIQRRGLGVDRPWKTMQEIVDPNRVERPSIEGEGFQHITAIELEPESRDATSGDLERVFIEVHQCDSCPLRQRPRAIEEIPSSNTDIEVVP